MSWYDTILRPFKVVVAWIMVGIHDGLTAIGLPAGPGVTWIMSIVLLTILIRILIIPLYLKQIRSSRGMAIVQPRMKEIQAKYKGKKDRVSQQQMNQELQQVYREYGVNPMASCFPVLIQMPVLIALYRVLWQTPMIAAGKQPALGTFDQQMAAYMDNSILFGAKLSTTFAQAPSGTRVAIIICVVLYAALMFLQQFVMYKWNMASQNDQQAKMMKTMMYIFPLMSGWFGFIVQLGVLIYLVVTMVFGFLQQLAVLYFLPTPNSTAHKAMIKRHQKKYDDFKSAEQQSYRQQLENLGLAEEDVLKAQRLRQKAINKNAAKGNDSELDESEIFAQLEQGEKLQQALKLHDQHQAKLQKKAQDLELVEKPRRKNAKPSRMQKMMDKQMQKAAAGDNTAGRQAGAHNPQAQPKRLTRAQREAQAKRREAFAETKQSADLSPEELEMRRQQRQRQRREQRKKKRNRK